MSNNGTIVELEPTPNDPTTWPDRAQAAKIRGCSVSTIRNLEKRGVLVAKIVGGVARFDPEQIELAKQPVEELTAAELLTAAASLLRQAENHNERFLELVVVPSAQLHTALAASNKLLADRVESLEKKNSEMLKASEEALSLQHERHLAQAKFDAGERRKSAAFGEFMKHVPSVAKAAIAKFGVFGPGAPASSSPAPASSPPPAAASSPDQARPSVRPEPTNGPTAPSDADEEAAFKVHRRLGQLSDDQIATMVSGGFLSEEEGEAFRRYRAAISGTADAPPTPKEDADAEPKT